MVFCLTWLLLLHIEELYNCIMPSITAPETFLLDGFQQDRDRSRSCFPNTPWCTELQLSRFRLEQTLYYVVVAPLDLHSNSGAINRWRQSTENLKNRFGLKIFFFFSVLLFYYFDLFSLKEIPLACFWFTQTLLWGPALRSPSFWRSWAIASSSCYISPPAVPLLCGFSVPFPYPVFECFSYSRLKSARGIELLAFVSVF